MKKLLTGFICFQLAFNSSAQINVEEYLTIIDKADSLYDAKNYYQAAITYSEAFAGIRKGFWPLDRVRAVSSWFLNGNTDSAFYQLNNIANSEYLTFDDVDDILHRKILVPLHNDSRWENLKRELFFQAYRNLLSAQRHDEHTLLSKKDSVQAIALGEYDETALSHLNDPAYVLLKNKMFDKAYYFFKATIESFPSNLAFYKNMMDYYKAIGDKSRAYIYFSKAEVLKYKQPAIISDTSLQFDAAIEEEYHHFSKMIGQDFLPPEYLVKMVADAVYEKGMKDKEYQLSKMNLENYPNSFRANKEMGLYYEDTGDKQKTDEYKTRSLILQYNLPENFFDASFDVEQYILERQITLTKRKINLPAPPQQFIEDIAKHFLYKKSLNKSERLFEINALNYPYSFYAQKNMSVFYKTIKDSIKEKEYNVKAQEAGKKYGTRRNWGFIGGSVIDSTFDITVSSPVCNVNCPVILIDDLHDKATVTKGWDQITLYNLFSNDGFKVIHGKTYFTRQSLSGINVVVMAGGILDKEEMKVLNEWIRNGGSLLAFTHHHLSPIYQDYLKTLGVQTLEIEFTQDSLHGLLHNGFIISPNSIHFSAEDKLLGNHAIIRGRNNSEAIRQVQALSSATIIGPPGSLNLLPLDKSAIDLIGIDNSFAIESLTPVKTKGQRSLGIAFNFGKGKIVITDALALKALLSEPSESGRLGMNMPGNDNKQYALNIMRWLTGYLK